MKGATTSIRRLSSEAQPRAKACANMWELSTDVVILSLRQSQKNRRRRLCLFSFRRRLPSVEEMALIGCRWLAATMAASDGAHCCSRAPFLSLPLPACPFFFIGYITSSFFCCRAQGGRDNEDFDANDLNDDDPKSDPDILGTF
jgi:hypothetical protein